MKRLFSVSYYLLALVSAATALLALWGHPVWGGVLLTALPPLVQRIRPFDLRPSIHHKVRLPLVSLLVLAGIAWVLLAVPGRTPALWLALACLGGFLLNTYWAEGRDSGPNGA